MAFHAMGFVGAPWRGSVVVVGKQRVCCLAVGAALVRQNLPRKNARARWKTPPLRIVRALLRGVSVLVCILAITANVVVYCVPGRQEDRHPSLCHEFCCMFPVSSHRGQRRVVGRRGVGGRVDGHPHTRHSGIARAAVLDL